MADGALDITCYLTPVKIPAVNTAHRSEGGDTIYLMPATYEGRSKPMPVDVFLVHTGFNPIGCKFKTKVAVGHTWLPDPQLESSVAPFRAIATIVKIDLPRSPFWAGADLSPQLTESDQGIGPTPATGPAGGSTDESLLIPRLGWEAEIHPVPGEDLLVTHNTYGQGSWSISGYHSCKGLTGGTITARRSHPTVEDAYLYDVEVEGSLFVNVMPTDFEPRTVGDWCFLLRSFAEAGDMVFKAETPKSPLEDEVLRIAPLSIMGEG